ncbi:MAG: hypothetical protein MJZ89_03900, partial [Paludibacteraceae bacterium]|nr:hypothetical protein [Paludibacteraceae bacterium]
MNTKKIFAVMVLATLTGNMFAAWTGSGHGEEHNGVWYVVYNTTEYSIGAYSNNSGVDFVLSGPGAILSYDIWKRASATQTTYIYGYNAADQRSTIASYEPNVLGTSAANKSNNISLDITKIKAQASGTLVKFIKNVFVTMAQYLETPSKTSLDFGNKLIGAEDDVQTFTIAWCNVPAMTWEVQGVANGVVEVSVDANSQEGYYNTSTFTVTYHHAAVSDLTNAKIVISDSFNGYSQTINLAGATENVLTPEYTWNIESTIHVGDVVENVVASNSPAALTYTILSFTPAVAEVASDNTFAGNTFTANRAGVATIKVSQPATTGFYAGEDTKDITIEKCTPEFSLNIA